MIVTVPKFPVTRPFGVLATVRSLVIVSAIAGDVRNPAIPIVTALARIGRNLNFDMRHAPFFLPKFGH